MLVVGGAAFVYPGAFPPISQRGVWESFQTAELFDPASGTFTPTGSLQTARTTHIATLQNDGTVLVTGGKHFFSPSGTNYDIVLSTSELFDPAKGSFAPTGSMTTLRTGQSAILLNDGTVLVAGGNNIIALDTAEFSDPKSSTFTLTGGMETARFQHTATLLQDGRVLVTGGADFTVQSGKPVSTPLSSAELFQ